MKTRFRLSLDQDIYIRTVWLDLVLVIVFLVTNTLIYNDCLYIYMEDTNDELSVCLSPRSFSTIARSYRVSILTDLESLVVVLLYLQNDGTFSL